MKKTTLQGAIGNVILNKQMGALDFAATLVSLAGVTVFCDSTYGVTEEGLTEEELQVKVAEFMENDKDIARKLLASATLLDRMMKNPVEFFVEAAGVSKPGIDASDAEVKAYEEGISAAIAGAKSPTVH